MVIHKLNRDNENEDESKNANPRPKCKPPQRLELFPASFRWSANEFA